MLIFEYTGSTELLRSILINDFKLLGIKISKVYRRLAIETTQNADKLKGSPLGCDLESLPVEELQGFGCVPKFLVKVVQLLEEGLDCEGIFRKSGSVTRVKELQVRISQGENVSSANPLDAAGLIKQFVRELAETLLTSGLQDQFLRCQQISKDEGECVSAVLKLCLLLPTRHLSVLRYIMSLLYRVSARQEQNKMTTSNLAVCLCPSVFRCAEGMNDLNNMKYVQAQTRTVQLLIENSSQIGVISDELCERLLSTATSCCADDNGFISDNDNDDEDDDDDEGDDNGDSGSGGSNGKLDKKRSGSFQGLVSNLSSSFSRWRSKEKQSSSISAAVAAAQQAAAAAQQAAAEGEAVTPVLIRKRKAEDNGVVFSVGKKKAILQNMPHMSTLGTPASIFKDRGVGMADSMGNSSIHTNVQFCDTTWNRNSRPDTSMSSAADSSMTSKGKVRKSFQGLLRRLSGSKDSGNLVNANFGSLLGDETDSSTTQRYDGCRPSSSVHRVDLCRSPSAPSMDHLDKSSAGVEAGDERSGRSRQRDDHARKRSVSEDAVGSALRRGRPNTVRTGLPSPLHRRASDANSTRGRIAMPDGVMDSQECDRIAPSGVERHKTDDGDLKASRSLHIIDTSPIAVDDARLNLNDLAEFNQSDQANDDYQVNDNNLINDGDYNQDNDVSDDDNREKYDDDSNSEMGHDEAFIGDEIVMMKDDEIPMRDNELDSSEQENMSNSHVISGDTVSEGSKAMDGCTYDYIEHCIKVCDPGNDIPVTLDESNAKNSQSALTRMSCHDDLMNYSPCEVTNEMDIVASEEYLKLSSMKSDKLSSFSTDISIAEQPLRSNVLADVTNEISVIEQTVNVAGAPVMKSAELYVHKATPRPAHTRAVVTKPAVETAKLQLSSTVPAAESLTYTASPAVKSTESQLPAAAEKAIAAATKVAESSIHLTHIATPAVTFAESSIDADTPAAKSAESQLSAAAVDLAGASAANSAESSSHQVHIATPFVKSTKSLIPRGELLIQAASPAVKSTTRGCGSSEGGTRTPTNDGTPKIKQPLLSNVVTKRILGKSGSLAISSPTRRPVPHPPGSEK